ncbi:MULTISPECIES: SDR family oxidoreductase [Sinorhizobium]|jgi:NAD(P)-dependent dehydrogenase (short-subunit alcohol dehydrogenase family)|uniref:SDR family oxidoreductase n=1 Tax=Sinorhizobium TaxID=28105 RepID=UPI00037877CF|nr:MULTISPECIES: SDR family oxidoreductase [Sinorhizobium]PND19545.1 short-chain dehydrogenase [Ensifer sp. MMN_5]PND29471.1 short-chain dehydrogenase [Sinorhizobium sp. M4_45]
MTERTFLITGASKGIGRALSNRLAAAGHHVVGIARGQDPDFPGTLVSIDLDDSKASGQAFADLAQRYSFDGVVNNVGLARLHPVGEIDLADVEEMLRVNIHPTIQTAQAILPAMRAKGWGRIVNITSLVTTGTPLRSGYAAAKAAVNSLTRTWAVELAETGITVNAVAPGPVETEMFRRNTPAGSEAEGRFLSMIPMRRLGKPEEIAAAIAFLLSDDAGFITGQTLFVDGGGSVGRSAA